MKVKCKVCGDMFTVPKDTQELFDEGHIECPDICLECLEHEQCHFEQQEEPYSDGDPGL